MITRTFRNTITALVRLSSLSKSGLLVPPSLVVAMDKMVKEEFASWRDMWFDCLLVSTAVVVLGLALEGPELYHEIRHLWLDRRDENMFFVLTGHKMRPRWKFLSFVGWILIVVGVAGEGFFETMVSLADGKLQTFNDILLDSTTREAGSAAESAKSAHDELAAVQQDAKTLHQQLDEDFAALRLLTKDVSPQLPRGVLLSRDAPKLIGALTRFQGQKVVIFEQPPTSPDAGGVWDQLIEIFGPSGARWVFPRGVPPILMSSNSFGPGLHVFVSSRATKPVRDAAQVLSTALAGTLPPGPSTILVLIDPTTPAIERPYGQGYADNPFHELLSHPDEIAIEIGEHPSLFWTQKRNATRKKTNRP